MDQSIMNDFLFRVGNDGTMDMVHVPCKQPMRTERGAILNPINLAEAYNTAYQHLLNLCPGGHSFE